MDIINIADLINSISVLIPLEHKLITENIIIIDEMECFELHLFNKVYVSINSKYLYCILKDKNINTVYQILDTKTYDGLFILADEVPLEEENTVIPKDDENNIENLINDKVSFGVIKYIITEQYRNKLKEISYNILNDVVKQKIQIDLINGIAKPHKTKFHIKIGSSPNGSTSNFDCNRKVFGHIIDSNILFLNLGIWEGGKPIIDPNSGIEIGAVNKNNLYIYLPVRAIINNFGIYEKILLQAKDILLGNDIVNETQIVNIMNKEMINMLREKITDNNNILEKKIRYEEDSHQYYIKSIRDTMNYRNLIKSLEKKLEDLKCSDIKTMLQNIRKIDYVNSACLRGYNVILCKTDNIYYFNSGNYYDIGIFNIIINIQKMKISVLNLKHRIHGFERNMHAPHIFNNGRMCQGNIAESISQLFAINDYCSIVSIIIQFLHSVNLHDQAGRKFYKWPMVTDELIISELQSNPYISKERKEYEESITDED